MHFLFLLLLSQSSIKAKQLTSLLVQSLLNGEEELKNEKLVKLAADTKLDIKDAKSCVSLVEFILLSAAKNLVSGETLSSELQQLGLPKGHFLFSSPSSPSTTIIYQLLILNVLHFLQNIQHRCAKFTRRINRNWKKSFAALL